MAKKKYIYLVSHPNLGEVKVQGEDGHDAIRAACVKWEEDFSAVAGYCTVRRLGPATQPKCRRCGRPFGEPGSTPGTCMDCQRKESYFEREKRSAYRYYDAKRKKERFA